MIRHGKRDKLSISNNKETEKTHLNKDLDQFRRVGKISHEKVLGPLDGVLDPVREILQSAHGNCRIVSLQTIIILNVTTHH